MLLLKRKSSAGRAVVGLVGQGLLLRDVGHGARACAQHHTGAHCYIVGLEIKIWL